MATGSEIENVYGLSSGYPRPRRRHGMAGARCKRVLRSLVPRFHSIPGPLLAVRLDLDLPPLHFRVKGLARRGGMYGDGCAHSGLTATIRNENAARIKRWTTARAQTLRRRTTEPDCVMKWSRQTTLAIVGASIEQLGQHHAGLRNWQRCSHEPPSSPVVPRMLGGGAFDIRPSTGTLGIQRIDCKFVGRRLAGKRRAERRGLASPRRDDCARRSCDTGDPFAREPMAASFAANLFERFAMAAIVSPARRGAGCDDGGA
jgi:hypothetical protein